MHKVKPRLTNQESSFFFMSLPHSLKSLHFQCHLLRCTIQCHFLTEYASLSNSTLNCVSVQIHTATSVFCIQLRSWRLSFVPKIFLAPFCPHVATLTSSPLSSSPLYPSGPFKGLQRTSKDPTCRVFGLLSTPSKYQI